MAVALRGEWQEVSHEESGNRKFQSERAASGGDGQQGSKLVLQRDGRSDRELESG